MAVKDIEDAHHVVRHCRSRLMDVSDPSSPEPFPEAFELRSGEEYLSASYYEFFPGSHDERLVAARDTLALRFKGLKDSDALIMMNAGAIRGCGNDRDVPIRVVHQPTKPAPDYAGIRGLPSAANAELNSLLCTLAVRDVVFLRDLP